MTAPRPYDRTIDVRDYGAVCDGIHDDTDALLAALEAARKLPDGSGLPGIRETDE